MIDAFDIARISGQYAVPVALAETLLAGWLLAKAGQQCELGPMTVAPMRDGPAIQTDDAGRVDRPRQIGGIRPRPPHLIVVVARA